MSPDGTAMAVMTETMTEGGIQSFDTANVFVCAPTEETEDDG